MLNLTREARDQTVTRVRPSVVQVDGGEIENGAGIKGAPVTQKSVNLERTKSEGSNLKRRHFSQHEAGKCDSVPHKNRVCQFHKLGLLGIQ